MALPVKRPFPTPSTAPRASSRAPLTRTPFSSRTRTRTATRTQTARVEDAYVIAVIDNAVKDVGFAAYNLRGFDVELRQFSDSNTFAVLVTALCVFAPVEVLLSVSSAGGLLDQALRACPHLVNVKRTFIGRTYFNETYGALVAERLSNARCPILHNLGESSCYLALASCGALIRYVEHVDELSFAPASLRIRYRPNDGAVFLDMATLEGLEIVSNMRQRVGVGGTTSSACLLRVMDKTKTRVGKRFLRRSLLEPCADSVTITMRQDAVQDLGNSEEMYFALTRTLSRFPDLEGATASLLAKENARLRIIGVTNDKMHTGAASGDDGSDSDESCERGAALLQSAALLTAPPSASLILSVLNIKAALEAVPQLLEAVQDSQSPLLKALAQSMRNPCLQNLQKEIANVIDPEALPAREIERMRMQGAFAVKSGRNGRLDVSRKTLSENVEDMQMLTEDIQKKYGYPKLQLCLHARRGYHFAINRKYLDLNDFPEEFIQIDEGKKVHRFSIVELEQLNARYNDSLQEIWRLTEIELSSLLNEIFRVEVLTALHRLCDTVAILDTIASFVTYSSFCQAQTETPRLTAGGPIALQKAYHPTLLDLKPQSAVPNDIFLDETSALHIISGRNQAGKSTFMRMVGLMSIMAHTGCMIPAKFATVRILKRVCTRFNTGDDITQSESHFSREMRDISVIVDSVRENSDAAAESQGSSDAAHLSERDGNTLVLIDELGRSTSTVDGFSIAYAVAEHLASIPNVLTLFVTHFLGLGALETVNPTVNAFHLDGVAVSNQKSRADNANAAPQMKFTYTVVSGILKETNYGIETARMAGFPADIVADAYELRKHIPVRSIATPSDFESAHLRLTQKQGQCLQRIKSMLAVAQKVSLINSSTTDKSEIQRLLSRLQEKVKIAQRSSKSRGEACSAVTHGGNMGDTTDDLPRRSANTPK